MWWGGFSEDKQAINLVASLSLNPHVVGRFFRGMEDVGIVDIEVS